RTPAPVDRPPPAISVRPYHKDCCASQWRMQDQQIPAPPTRQRPDQRDCCKRVPCPGVAVLLLNLTREARSKRKAPLSDGDSHHSAGIAPAEVPGRKIPVTQPFRLHRGGRPDRSRDVPSPWQSPHRNGLWWQKLFLLKPADGRE